MISTSSYYPLLKYNTDFVIILIDTMAHPSNNLAWRSFNEKMREKPPKVCVADYIGALTVYGSESKFPKNIRDKFQMAAKTDEYKTVIHQCRKTAAKMGINCFSDEYDTYFVEDIKWKVVKKKTLKELRKDQAELIALKNVIKKHEINIPRYDFKKKTIQKA